MKVLKQRFGRLPDAVTGDEPTLMALCTGAMWVAGAALVAASVAVPHVAGGSNTGLLALAGAVFVFGLFGVAQPQRIPPRLALLQSVACHPIIAALVVLSGDPGSSFAFFYGWAVVHAGFFMSPRLVALHVGLATTSYGGALWFLSAGPAGFGHALLLTGALVVVGGLTAVLRHRVRELMTELGRASRTDSLTGFLNRVAFDDRLRAEIARAGRSAQPLSVLAIDLDHFKRVNGLLGHGSGDTVLQRVADILRDTVRTADAVARIGGAEFLVLLPDTDAQAGFVAAERVRAALREAYEGQLTASLGVAGFPLHSDTPEGLLRAGEQALNAAKELGRDRSVIYSPEVASILARAAGRKGSEGDIHLATILTLAEALDMRDMGTARHSETVGRYAEAMARELGFSPDRVERVRLAGVLHDIGKIGVRDSVLMKPSKLTDEEYAEMKKHAEIGARIVSSADLEDIRGWVLAHHERPDGRGYPKGLAGEEIPLEARILAVADSYEAMTAERVYKRAMPVEDARAELRRCAGAQFDEQVVDAFLRLPDYETGSVAPTYAA